MQKKVRYIVSVLAASLLRSCAVLLLRRPVLSVALTLFMLCCGAGVAWAETVYIDASHYVKADSMAVNGVVSVSDITGVKSKDYLTIDENQYGQGCVNLGKSHQITFSTPLYKPTLTLYAISSAESASTSRSITVADDAGGSVTSTTITAPRTDEGRANPSVITLTSTSEACKGFTLTLNGNAHAVLCVTYETAPFVALSLPTLTEYGYAFTPTVQNPVEGATYSIEVNRNGAVQTVASGGVFYVPYSTSELTYSISLKQDGTEVWSSSRTAGPLNVPQTVTLAPAAGLPLQYVFTYDAVYANAEVCGQENLNLLENANAVKAFQFELKSGDTQLSIVYQTHRLPIAYSQVVGKTVQMFGHLFDLYNNNWAYMSWLNGASFTIQPLVLTLSEPVLNGNNYEVTVTVTDPNMNHADVTDCFTFASNGAVVNGSTLTYAATSSVQNITVTASTTSAVSGSDASLSASGTLPAVAEQTESMTLTATGRTITASLTGVPDSTYHIKYYCQDADGNAVADCSGHGDNVTMGADGTATHTCSSFDACTHDLCLAARQVEGQMWWHDGEKWNCSVQGVTVELQYAPQVVVGEPVLRTSDAEPKAYWYDYPVKVVNSYNTAEDRYAVYDTITMSSDKAEVVMAANGTATADDGTVTVAYRGGPITETSFTVTATSRTDATETATCEVLLPRVVLSVNSNDGIATATLTNANPGVSYHIKFWPKNSSGSNVSDAAKGINATTGDDGSATVTYTPAYNENIAQMQVAVYYYYKSGSYIEYCNSEVLAFTTPEPAEDFGPLSVNMMHVRSDNSGCYYVAQLVGNDVREPVDADGQLGYAKVSYRFLWTVGDTKPEGNSYYDETCDYTQTTSPWGVVADTLLVPTADLGKQIVVQVQKATATKKNAVSSPSLFAKATRTAAKLTMTLTGQTVTITDHSGTDVTKAFTQFCWSNNQTELATTATSRTDAAATSCTAISPVYGRISVSNITATPHVFFVSKTGVAAGSGYAALAIAEGNDGNDGRTPHTALFSLSEAYNRLRRLNPQASGTVDDYRIVIIGEYDYNAFSTHVDNTYIANSTRNNYRWATIFANKIHIEEVVKNVPATITGTYSEATNASGTDYNITGGRVCAMSERCELFADTRFEHLEFFLSPRYVGNGSNISNREYNFFLTSRGHNVTMGEGLTFREYYKTSESMGMNEALSVPNINVLGGFYQNDNPEVTVPGEHAVRYPFPVSVDRLHPRDLDGNTYTERRVAGKVGTLTVLSGSYGRIMGMNRNQNDYINPHSKNILGSPQYPFIHNIVVNLSTSDYNSASTEGETFSQVNAGAIVAGSTDGCAYADIHISIEGGKYGRVYGGHIGYGRQIRISQTDTRLTTDEQTALAGYTKTLAWDVTDDDGTTTKEVTTYDLTAHYPTDSYWGRSQIDIKGTTEVDEVFGATLGRFAHDLENYTFPGKDNTCFSYGQFEINVMDQATVNNRIYAGSAGGVVGLGTDTHHNTDLLVPVTSGTWTSAAALTPYATGDGWLYLPATQAVGKMVTVSGRQSIDLNQTTCRVNITGGTLGTAGNTSFELFGSGYGYIDNMDYDHATAEAGNVYGDTYINISGGMVNGDVFGGGKGDDTYYTDAIAAGIDATEAAAEFGSLAQVFGTTHVTVTGGQVSGHIYGAGRGYEADTFVNMARLTGRSYVAVDGVALSGSVLYGGGSYANVEGNTQVTLDGASHVSAIFGGGRQGNIHGNSTTFIKGGTVQNLVVGASAYATNVGSTAVLIGVPQYYICQQTGAYAILRGDKSADNLALTTDGTTKVIKDTVCYRAGDIVAANVYDMMTDGNKASSFTLVDESASTISAPITINNAVYGGGFTDASGSTQAAGVYTVQKDADGYGGNTTVIVADDRSADEHVSVSTQGGGLYGSGRLVLAEGFRAGHVVRYGKGASAQSPTPGSAEMGSPKEMTAFQRFDLMSVDDCCLSLSGARDLATPVADAELYSMTRIDELRMNSSTAAGTTLTTTNRNYIALQNNVHYLGAIVSNTAFTDTYHNASGTQVNGTTYRSYKQGIIDAYYPDNVQNAFRTRNVGTSKNAIGINNGKYLAIINGYTQTASTTDQGVALLAAPVEQTYYGPVEGVVEVILLNHTAGDGGGYVYADNVHGDTLHFLNTSGNFVFATPAAGGDGANKQYYIIDDCYPNGFGTSGHPSDYKPAQRKNAALQTVEDEAHYWYIRATSYRYERTLTAYTFDSDLTPIRFYLYNANTPETERIYLEGAGSAPLKVTGISWTGGSGQNIITGNTAGYQLDMSLLNYVTTSSDEDESAGTTSGVIENEYVLRALTDGALTATGTVCTLPVEGTAPYLNFHLTDAVDNTDDSYYDTNLATPAQLTLTLQTDETNATTYTIVLNIKYMQGPKFTGSISTPDCMLPGEKIRVTKEVTSIEWPSDDFYEVEDGRYWGLIAKVDEGVWDYDNIIRMDSTDDGNLEFLAQYMHNDWLVAYFVETNAASFAFGPSRLVVHNYHRMKDVRSQGLKPVQGSKIYIEDEEDLNAFVLYVCWPYGQVSETYTSGNKSKTYTTHSRTYIDYILLNDITLTHALNAGRGNALGFISALHGNGHVIDLNGHDAGFIPNMGSGANIYNLGVVGGPISEYTSGGKIHNSFVKGAALVWSPDKFKWDNCYHSDAASTYGTYATDDDFASGRVAYNLNRYYLAKRQALAGAADQHPATAINDACRYVYDYYADGDYRYARTQSEGAAGVRPYLRTAASPNYGSTETAHDRNHTHDASRWCEGSGCHEPNFDGNAGNYPNDFLFFGQNLTTDACPQHIDIPTTQSATPDVHQVNRVFRASGFYGSKHDVGIHFNRNATFGAAHAHYQGRPLTAIDFTGVRDGECARQYQGGWTTTLDNDLATGVNDTLQTVFYAPMLDYDCILSLGTTITDFALSGDVTQNLLVYTTADGADYTQVREVLNYDAATAISDIRGHQVAGLNVLNGLFHLVDKEDFNAPIQFSVGTKAWYERTPLTFADGTGAGWEAISLPFTVKRVEAATTQSEAYGHGNKGDYVINHGEITHFYGKEGDQTNTNNSDYNQVGHEYWLRGLTAADNAALSFRRPTAESGQGGFVDAKVNADRFAYNYQNTHLADITGNAADNGNQYYSYYSTAHTYTDYLPLAADVPFIISYPGEEFYEFNMSHETMTYSSLVKSGDSDNGATVVRVSDDRDNYTRVGDYTYQGTFMHHILTTGDYTLNANGSAFVATPDDGNPNTADGKVWPFRAYLTTAAAGAPQYRIAGARAEEDADEQDPADRMDEGSLQIYIAGMTLVVKADKAQVINLYSADGVLVSHLRIREGVNRFPLRQKGVYVANGRKLVAM